MVHEITLSRPPMQFPGEEYRKRVERLARAAARSNLDALFVVTPLNRLYLTGFAASNAVLLLEPGRKPTFYTDFRYLEMARAEIGCATVADLTDRKKLFGPLAARRKWRRVGYEGSQGCASFATLIEAMPSVSEWVDAEKDIMALRAVKSPREQAALQIAVQTGDIVFENLLEEVQPGMTEWDIRCLLRGLVDVFAQGESFDCIVCVGSNASKCHHRPSLRQLRRGQELLVDMGVWMDGYASDLTRTVFYGKPSKKLGDIYKIVLDANRKAIQAVRAGRTCGEVDAVARGIITKAGYGKYFGHNLGHAVGLAVHEDPRLAPGSKEILKAGMVLTVEPGIYLPGVGGVRIEDMVLVRPNGCEILTATPKDLLAL
jgi:Xaa-Pro aminopeptidase